MRKPYSKRNASHFQVVLTGLLVLYVLYVDAHVPACALQEKRLACERYTEMHEELSGMKDRSEREMQSLKEHLRLAMAALQEGQKLGNSLDHWESVAGLSNSDRHSVWSGLMERPQQNKKSCQQVTRERWFLEAELF